MTAEATLQDGVCLPALLPIAIVRPWRMRTAPFGSLKYARSLTLKVCIPGRIQPCAEQVDRLKRSPERKSKRGLLQIFQGTDAPSGKKPSTRNARTYTRTAWQRLGLGLRDACFT